jgi:hypothetical protein
MALGSTSRTAHPKAFQSLGHKVDHSGLANLTPQQIAA